MSVATDTVLVTSAPGGHGGLSHPDDDQQGGGLLV